MLAVGGVVAKDATLAAIHKWGKTASTKAACLYIVFACSIASSRDKSVEIVF